MKIKGLFLDFDGTIADSRDTLKSAYRDFLAAFGRQSSEQEFERLNGPPLNRIVATLKTTHELPGSEAELLARYVELVEGAHAAALPSPGARKILKTARHKAWRIAIVTSASRAATRRWLQRTELSEFVDVVIGGGDVRCGKPSPEPYLKALSTLRCDVDASVAVEDSAQGATSAVGAGLATIVVGPYRSTERWPAGVIFRRSLSEVALEL